MSISATITAVNAPFSVNEGAITALLVSAFGSVASLILMTFSSPFAEALALIGQY